MRQLCDTLAVETRGGGLYEVTERIESWLTASDIRDGLLTVFIRHTSASLLIQENADADVLADLRDFFQRLVPEDSTLYRHMAEGPDDMPAHIRAALTQTSLAIPVRAGAMLLGTWQGVYVFEHRHSPHRRTLVLHLLGD